MVEKTTNENIKANEELTFEKLSKKDIKNAWFRWWFANEMAHSFDRFLAGALTWALEPTLKKLYKNDDELAAAYERHLLFYNTNANWGGGTILGIMMSMEEQRAHQIYETGETEVTNDSIYSIKSGLMGALAGVGDSIDSFTIMYILISLGLPWAENGNPLGAILPFVIFVVYQLLMGLNFTRMGYSLGTSAASEIVTGQRAKSIVDGLSIVGMFMMGVLVANYVNITASLTWTDFAGENSLQDTLDTILPGILPFATVMSLYWYYTRKEFNVLKAVIFLTIALGALATIGIL